MITYGIIILLVAILFITLGACIFRGNIGLIHDYHQTNVKDKVNYGKAMGKAISGIGIAAMISGFISFSPDISASIAVRVFIIGFIICFFFIYKTQKKYNGGIF